jgi:hypothetical protein
MAWVIEGRRSVPGRPLPSSRIPSSPLFAAVLAIAAVSLLIAVAFALAGAWLVLPFAGLELAGLAWALCHAARRRAAAVPPSATARRAFLARPPCSAVASSAPTFCAARMAASRSRPVPATWIRMINLRRKPF